MSGRHGATRRRRPGATVAAAVAAAALVTGTAYVVDGVAGAPAGAGAGVAPLGPGPVTIRLGIEHSRFDVEKIRVVAGTRARFVVDNGDPIGHELILGPPEVHARHESGTHAGHPSIPGEVSVGPGALGVTVYDFDQPGTVEYACHLPGHYAYGMHGEVEVVAADRVS